MIDEEEIENNASLFEVPLTTIVKDHAISHALFCLSQIIGKDEEKKVLFYGGTALNRTHFTDFRLSEDIDLMIKEYPAWIKIMQPQLLASMRKVFPSAQWKDDLAHQSGHVDSPEECYANLLKAVEKAQYLL